MKRVIIILAMAVMAAFSTSCNNDKSVPEGECWGHTEYYEDFLLLWKYEPVVMRGTIDFDMNEDALNMLNKYKGEQGVVKFYLSSDKDEVKVPQDVIIYFNGEKCPDGCFAFTPSVDINSNKVKEDLADDGYVTVPIDLGIELKDSAKEGEHHYYILYEEECTPARQSIESAYGTVDINGDLLSVDIASFDNVGIYVTKEKIHNPAKVVTIWVSLVVISLLLLWYLVVRPAKWRHLYFSKMYISYPGVGDDIPVTTRGCCRLILTDKPIKQSIFKKIFLIPDAVEVNEVWTSRVTITCRDRRRLRILGGVMYTPDEPLRGEEIIITTDEGVKVKMNS